MTTNNESLAPQNLVTQILKKIRLENVATNNIDSIKEIGAHEGKILEKTIWTIAYDGERDLANKLYKLIQVATYQRKLMLQASTNKATLISNPLAVTA
jgi:hypothetical protein